MTHGAGSTASWARTAVSPSRRWASKIGHSPSHRDRGVSSGSVGKGHVLLPAAGCLLVHYLRVLHGILASWAFSKIGNALEKILLTQL